MLRPALEVADIFRDHGAAWRAANAGHLSLDQWKVMTAIERCRTAALGGHVERCEKCSHTIIAYNSCRNRHCPKCQGAAAREWLAEREAELLPVPYYHVVFTLPARIGFLSVLHTWGSPMTHHPHAHMIVPGGGFSLDGHRWVACRPRFLLAVPVLSELFLHKLRAAYHAGELQFFGKLARRVDPQVFAAYLRPMYDTNWRVYCKRPFGGPKEVLRYLARYTHRVAISNSRLLACDDKSVTFKWKDYRLEGRERYKVMTLPVHEFIRRFLMHVLPAGFHRIRCTCNDLSLLVV